MLATSSIQTTIMHDLIYSHPTNLPQPARRAAMMALAAGTAALWGCAAGPGSAAAEPTSPSLAKRQVVALLTSLATGDATAAAVINPGKYIQHNLGVADGLAGFMALTAQLPRGSVPVNVIRVFQDGDFVFTHTDYEFFGTAKVGFDIFRFEGKQIVEHWDNLQDKPKQPNPSGRGMLDGPSEVLDRERTADNKALVRGFVDDVLVHRRMERVAVYFDGDNYLQHNPSIPDRVSGLVAAIDGLARQGLVLKYDRIHHVLGEGNFVLVASEGSFAGTPTAFFDLFRVQGGKIAEHWDTVEAIPARAQWKNGNGKF
jgi:predicted SnoaL-like aldol condensation-catalyzing enzyme